MSLSGGPAAALHFPQQTLLQCSVSDRSLGDLHLLIMFYASHGAESSTQLISRLACLTSDAGAKLKSMASVWLISC
jgi:hypothetical protein